MRRYIFIVFIIFGLLFSGCNKTTNPTPAILDQFDVKQTADEQKEDDFIFRLVTEKAIYKKSEPILLYGEIEYVGEQDEVEISHSSSAIFFPLEEKTRAYEIDYGVEEIGLRTLLSKEIPYKENYVKRGDYSKEDVKDYRTFMKVFLQQTSFPTGYYVVRGATDFSVDGERITIEATVDFKVVEE